MMDLPASAAALHQPSAGELHELVKQLEANMGRVVLGKADVVRWCLVALLSGDR